MKYEDEIKNEVTEEPVEAVEEEKPAKKEKAPKKNANGEYSATVIGNGALNVRDGVDGAVMYEIPEGKVVKVVGEQGEWAKIVGYVKKAFLQEI